MSSCKLAPANRHLVKFKVNFDISEFTSEQVKMLASELRDMPGNWDSMNDLADIIENNE